ncbi:sarcoplasmic calcium-binding protein isoform X2 [Ostrinia furnacalis]|uniref:sarcoplasmic calcium-binding protein isoform X2 n=1 Tax=Ostrinia furnacalis TaxID=93504 RepID=UPI00103E20F1|nr:sarcoplasmic calcium-binding protein isoform X2 [Ostrinia furnacalis]
MAVSLIRFGLRSVTANLERTAAILSSASARQQIKLIHTKPVCHNGVCYLQERSSDGDLTDACSALRRSYSKHHGRPEEDRRKRQSDSDSSSDSDTECKGLDRSDFWRRKMRTVHNILDVDKDGLISFNDFVLFGERFKALGHLDEQQAKEFSDIIKMTWEEQWGAIDPYNYVTVEQYLEDMHHVLNDKTLKKKAHRWLPYLFKAVDKDKSGFISVKEFKLFFECLGLDNEHAAVAFAVIDTNGDGKLSLKEFVKLGKDFFFTEDETRVSKMFWGPLNEI